LRSRREVIRFHPSMREPQRGSLILFGISAVTVIIAFILTFFFLLVPIGQTLLERTFEEVRAFIWALWAVSVGTMFGAPLKVARELGHRARLSSLVMLDGADVRRALKRTSRVHALALITWPASFLLGPYYYWPIFQVHMLLTASVMLLATMYALTVVRAWRLEHLAPQPTRVSHCMPAGF
jgi:hypothetical protein